MSRKGWEWESRQGDSLAPGTRTIRMCSFDGRSWSHPDAPPNGLKKRRDHRRSKGQPRPLPPEQVRKLGTPHSSSWQTSACQLGERVKTSCAVEDQSAPIPEEIMSRLPLRRKYGLGEAHSGATLNVEVMTDRRPHLSGRDEGITPRGKFSFQQMVFTKPTDS